MCVGSLKLIRVVLMLSLAVGCASGAFGQTFTTYGGEATPLSGTVAGIPVNMAGTGTLDPGGGARNNSMVCYPGGPQCYLSVPDLTSGLLSVQLLNATTVGRGHQTHSYASVSRLSLLINGVSITADYVAATSKRTCEPPPGEIAPPAVEFANLLIGGIPVNPSGLPNQTISVPSPLGGTVTIVLNEQTLNTSGLTVRAMRVKALGLGGVGGTDVTIAKAHSNVKCGDVTECFADKVTAGGFIIRPLTLSKANFAAAGRTGSDWGHFLFIDHATGTKIKATEITSTVFSVENGHGVATITGSAEVNGRDSVTFVARLSDLGEPGNLDLFGLTFVGLQMDDPLLDLQVDPDQPIAGGNIQFHGPKPGQCPGDENPPPE